MGQALGYGTPLKKLFDFVLVSCVRGSPDFAPEGRRGFVSEMENPSSCVVGYSLEYSLLPPISRVG